MAPNTSTTATAADLQQLAADLAAAEHHLAEAVLAAGRLAGSGVCEKVEGLPLELFIGLATHMTAADRSVLIAAGQVLLQMPLTARLFENGSVSWSQVRRIVRAAKSLRADQREVLDERIAASAEQYGNVDAFGPDGLCGPIPRISLAALEALSRDADCRAVLFDGKRPLAVSRKLHAKDIPSDVDFAVGARDMGDRWPGSNDPLGHTDNHHITHRARGGVHSVDDIVRLSRRYHRLGHEQNWQMRLDPKSGTFTITRGKRTWRSLPRGTPLSHPRGAPPSSSPKPPQPGAVEPQA